MALEAVQARAGHASVESARVYLHLANDWLADQYRRAAELIDADAGRAGGGGPVSAQPARGRAAGRVVAGSIAAAQWAQIAAGVPQRSRLAARPGCACPQPAARGTAHRSRQQADPHCLAAYPPKDPMRTYQPETVANAAATLRSRRPNVGAIGCASHHADPGVPDQAPSHSVLAGTSGPDRRGRRPSSPRVG